MSSIAIPKAISAQSDPVLQILSMLQKAVIHEGSMRGLTGARLEATMGLGQRAIPSNWTL